MKTLLCLDFENDIIHPKGKVAGKGYADFAKAHGTLAKVQALQAEFRSKELPVVHVRVGFSRSFREQPKTSPLLGRAHEHGAFILDQWGTEFISDVAPLADELVVTKHRVGAFHGTALQLILRNMSTSQVVLAGVATDMAVEMTAREAHDRDFLVTVVSDCCVAATVNDHERSLASLAKIASVVAASELSLP